MTSTTFQKGWHALYVRSKTEKKINAILQELNFKTYLPLLKKIRNWSDRKKTIFEPLFPSYLFVYINDGRDINKILSLDYACSFVRFGRQYAIVSQKEIDSIRILLEGDSDHIKVIQNVPAVGEIRKIKYGLFKGLECEIVKVKNVEKILVRINSINLSISAKIPLTHLQVCSAV